MKTVTVLSEPRTAEASAVKRRPALSLALRAALVAGALCLLGVMVWQGITAQGAPDPTTPHTTPTVAVLDIGVLVFREGLECILVLSALLAGMTGTRQAHRRPVAWGVGVGIVATVLTWFVAVGIVSSLSESVSALNLQAATGLVAVVVLMVIMNWFFHKVYWGGWISLHHRKKKELLAERGADRTGRRLVFGLGLLGFSSLYREGFEVVLFLQTYRLQMGEKTVLLGLVLGLILSGTMAALTFVAHRRLPYRKMLILTGVMLGGVLLLMVGEQAQEMQLAHWISTTQIPWLSDVTPAWSGTWFSFFPTVETIAAQALTAALVIGSYFAARKQTGSAPPVAAVA